MDARNKRDLDSFVQLFVEKVGTERKLRFPSDEEELCSRASFFQTSKMGGKFFTCSPSY